MSVFPVSQRKQKSENLTEGLQLDPGLHLVVVGIHALADVGALVGLADVLDEEHDGGLAGELLGVHPVRRLYE